MFEKGEPADKHHETETEAIHEPRQIRSLMARNAIAKPFQNRRYRIEQKPFALVAKHMGIEKNRREENSKRQEYFHNELYVTEEKAGCGYNHGDAEGQNNHHQKKQWSPDQIYAPTGSHCQKQNHQGS